MDGGAGNDTLNGGSGDDIYLVSDYTDTLNELAGEGTDTVSSSVSYTLGNNIENLVLAGAENLDGIGNELGNVLTGNAGNNTLSGGGGNDLMGGGAGDDEWRLAA